MIEDQAKYLSGVAELVGVKQWSIHPKYIPPGALEETYAFVIEGSGNLPHLLDRAQDKLIRNVKHHIDTETDYVFLY